jgi:hypothetical protein
MLFADYLVNGNHGIIAKAKPSPYVIDPLIADYQTPFSFLPPSAGRGL